MDKQQAAGERLDIKVGGRVKLYGNETTVRGFYCSYNEALEKYETIILTDGRGDPLERSFDVIEVISEPEAQQSSSDAVAHAIDFALQVLDSHVYDPKDNTPYAERREKIANLHKLFNPSGVAPQANKVCGQDCRCASAEECQFNAGNLPKSFQAAPQAAGMVVIEDMAKALQQVNDFSTGKLGSAYLGCIIGDCNAVLQKYYESEPQQLFTREQLSKAYADGAIAAQLMAGGYPFQTESEYMNTNYGPKPGDPPFREFANIDTSSNF